MRWILDDGPFDTFARCVSPEATTHWPRGELWIAPATAKAADDRRGRLLTGDGAKPLVATFELIAGSEAFILLQTHLRCDDRLEALDLAEHQVIAHVLTVDREAVFTSYDKTALSLALAELGRGRVAHPVDLWDELRAEGRVDQARFEALVRSSLRRDQSMTGVPWRFRRRRGSA